MAAQFKQVGGEEAIDSLLEQSQTEMVVLFNHDPHCPISARAFKQMEQYEGAVAMVDVSKEKKLTKAIESRTGVRHESPQVFVLRNGQPIWSASHFAITVDAVQKATSAANGSSSAD